MIYTITGQGGSLLFAECLGKKENKKADNYFTISSGLSVMTGILLVLGDLYNTLDRSMYATVLGILDKVVSIPLIGGMLYIFFGGYGLIAAFPISVALLLIIVKSWNCSGR